jgi:5'-3' exonuclease
MMSKKTYILVDSLNMFFRAKHVGGNKDIDLRVGMAMHIMFNSIKKAWNDFDGSHVVLCLEGRSWRKDFYTPYKANRKVTMDKRSVREQEDDELFFEAYDDMTTFFREKSNCSVIRQANAEADDLIATWIQQHPDDNHVIISTDSDFYQLLAPNVTQYNGTTDQIVSLEGFKNAKTGEWVIDKKTGEKKTPVVPEWVLFEKCVRGDSADNVFSAYPGARLKGSKNKTGITEAYNDRLTGGYNYNNFMLQRWVDHEEVEHRVRDDFERNKILIDLTMQPDEIKVESKSIVAEAVNKEPVSQVGIHFMKFCNKWNLERMSQNPGDYAEFLNGKA